MFGMLSFKFGKNEGTEVWFAFRDRCNAVLTKCHSVYSTRKINMVCLCYININTKYKIERCMEINNFW